MYFGCLKFRKTHEDCLNSFFLSLPFSLYYKSLWEGVMVHYIINLVFVSPGCAPTICIHPHAKYTD